MTMTPAVDENQSRGFSVVIVGAGLAGLACASKLIDSHGVDPREVVVLEALDRVGGRTLTSKELPGGEPVDVGACWVCPRQKNVHRLLREHQLDVIEQQVSAQRVVVSSSGGLQGWLCRLLGKKWDPKVVFTTLSGLPAWDLFAIWRLTKKINAMAGEIPPGRPWDASGAEVLDSCDVSKWLEEEGAPRNPAARGLMRGVCTSVFCADASEVSMLLFLTVVSEEGGVEILMEEAQSQRVVQGNGTLSHRLASSLAEKGVDIRLGTQVVHCSHSALEGEGVTIVTRDGGKVWARRAVLAMPPPAIAGLSLQPKLEGALGAEMATQKMGKVIKVVVEFTTSWWRGAHCAMADPEILEATLAFDVSCLPLQGKPPRHILAIFFFGTKAEHWTKKTPEERVTEAVRCAKLLFGNANGNASADQTIKIIASTEGNWPSVPGIRGGYMSFPSLGSIVATRSYSCSAPQSCLHFASTENASGWRGYMDGAIQSGERAAAEVAEALGKKQE